MERCCAHFNTVTQRNSHERDAVHNCFILDPCEGCELRTQYMQKEQRRRVITDRIYFQEEDKKKCRPQIRQDTENKQQINWDSLLDSNRLAVDNEKDNRSINNSIILLMQLMSRKDIEDTLVQLKEHKIFKKFIEDEIVREKQACFPTIQQWSIWSHRFHITDEAVRYTMKMISSNMDIKAPVKHHQVLHFKKELNDASGIIPSISGHGHTLDPHKVLSNVAKESLNYNQEISHNSGNTDVDNKKPSLLFNISLDAGAAFSQWNDHSKITIGTVHDIKRPAKDVRSPEGIQLFYALHGKEDHKTFQLDLQQVSTLVSDIYQKKTFKDTDGIIHTADIAITLDMPCQETFLGLYSCHSPII